MGQREVFIATEGNSWFKRNAAALDRNRTAAIADPLSDPVIATLEPFPCVRVLEIGCANGWRLDALRRHWKCEAFGIDASAEAVANAARFEGISVQHGTAEELPFAARQFDCVILGFLLYCCDRGDLFRIAAEVDRVLAPGGYIAIWDFLPDFPHRRDYVHSPGLSTYKMDYASMWNWHTRYTQVARFITAHDGCDVSDPDQRLAVTVLQG